MKAPELKDRLEESEKLIQEMTVTWEEKLRKTEEIAQVTHTQTVSCICFLFCAILPNTTCFFIHDLFILFSLCFSIGASEAVGEFRHFSAIFRD